MLQCLQRCFQLADEGDTLPLGHTCPQPATKQRDQNGRTDNDGERDGIMSQFRNSTPFIGQRAQQAPQKNERR
ncbi:hypothetical protein [Spirosoma aerophilum]